ncbi:DNA-directed RNA polymerase subunit delta [Bacillus sp. FJAT-50079]|nr:DNA-directed RNA polymerase subunit delta [Bacillus sp. FJAT-50079]MBS4206817.1 DNA-directed RNA polymerase subunit delta [Bacillus sp. FJAT-50079]
MSLLELSLEERREMSFIEIAEHIFYERREAIVFEDLVKEIASILELSKEELRPRMLQFYTDLNVEGRFITLGENRWGLREWYLFDQVDEEIITPVKPKKKKKKKVVELDDVLEEELEDEDLDYEEDDEDLEDEEEEDLDESLEALIEEEEEEYDEEDLLDSEFELDEDDELEIDEEEEEEEEEEE